ncbi:3,9-dihydroxypterocarpan 6A-monooxygenase-like [Prosopis cineraria]|uniref:3,9-dihydroxypterocarpan 6A-monooxygenase-like n=1 Tax=Prosopis cineraria TaxID=364024 RepID=UPI0024106DA0|nr:3,9-dihydroxypterocarpan 6A-monooxygenase-like [Prosopis cineraria]
MNSPCDSHPSTFLGLLLQSLSSSCNRGGDGGSSQLLRDLVTREVNAFLWLALIVVTALLLRKVVRLFRLWLKARKIPGIPSPSFYGHCKLISRENFTDLLSESHKRYGPVVKLWLGPTQLLVSVKDPVLIQEMLVKAVDKLPFTGKAFRLAFGQSSLFASSFEEVRKRREFLATELNERLLKNADLIPSTVIDFIMHKIENIRGDIDCRLISQNMAFGIMGAMFFGDGFLAWPKAAIYEELLMKIAKDACFWASYNVTPFWKRGFWRYQCLCTKLKCLTQDILEHCRKNCKLFHRIEHNVHSERSNAEMGTTHASKSYSDAGCPGFLGEHRDHNTAKEEPYGNIMGVMFHGCQTTAALISNVLTMLVMHPEIQDKVYLEIANVGKSPSKYEQEDIYRMPLLLATIYESARLLPSGPLLQRCSLKHDLSFATGVTIPAGAVLVVPIQLVQMDDSNWGSNASDFNPYRFLSNAGKGSKVVLDATNTGSADEHTNPGLDSLLLNDPNENAAFLPFGSGARACVGQKFVIQVVATLFALILKKYEVKLHPGPESDPRLTLKNHLLQKLPNSAIVFKRRDS